MALIRRRKMDDVQVWAFHGSKKIEKIVNLNYTQERAPGARSLDQTVVQWGPVRTTGTLVWEDHDSAVGRLTELAQDLFEESESKMWYPDQFPPFDITIHNAKEKWEIKLMDAAILHNGGDPGVKMPFEVAGPIHRIDLEEKI
jgi:hypothetical protein